MVAEQIVTFLIYVDCDGDGLEGGQPPNVCVESTLRDGFHLEYFGVVLADATHQAGPEFAQQAALYNIETFFGWVSSVDAFCQSFATASEVAVAS